jgi:hypothetical protein
MRNFLFIALLCGFAGVQQAVAQENDELSMGFQLGYNSARIIDDGYSSDALPGFNLGMLWDIPLRKRWYIQPGMLASRKGEKWADGSQVYTDALYYLEFPIMVSYRYPLGRKFKLRAEAGPYLSYGVLSSQDSFEEDDEYYSLYNKFDFGLSLGAGMGYKGIYVGLRYSAGFANLYRESGYRVNNRVLSVNFSWCFKLGEGTASSGRSTGVSDRPIYSPQIVQPQQNNTYPDGSSTQSGTSGGANCSNLQFRYDNLRNKVNNDYARLKAITGRNMSSADRRNATALEKNIRENERTMVGIQNEAARAGCPPVR